MPRVKNALHNEYQLLELLRDETALQAHLFKAEMKSAWEALELKWSELKEHLGRAEVAAADAGRDIDVASKALAESLRAGYTEIRDAFKR